MPHVISGLPVHPLAVHAAVVLVPLAALLAILFAIPRTRSWAALPMPLVAVAGLAAVFVARLSGENLKDYFIKLEGAKNWANSPSGKDIATHQSRANVLFYLMIVFAIVTIAVYVISRNRAKFTGSVMWASCALLVIGAVVIGVQVYLVGESGAKAVWNPDGTTNYNTSSPLISGRP